MIATGIDASGHLREEHLREPSQVVMWAREWIDGVRLHVPDAYGHPLEGVVSLGVSTEYCGVYCCIDDRVTRRYAAFAQGSAQWEPAAPMELGGAREEWPKELFLEAPSVVSLASACVRALKDVWQRAADAEGGVPTSEVCEEHVKRRRVLDLPEEVDGRPVYWVRSGEFPRARILPVGGEEDDVHTMRAEYDFSGAPRGRRFQRRVFAGEDLEKSWANELQRRVEEVRTGRARTFPSDVVLERLRAKLNSEH